MMSSICCSSYHMYLFKLTTDINAADLSAANIFWRTCCYFSSPFPPCKQLRSKACINNCSQAEVIPTCRELGIAIVPYSPLGRGFLTGNIRSLKNLHESDVRFTISPRFQGENFEKVGLLQLPRPVATLACSITCAEDNDEQHSYCFLLKL